MSNVASQKSVMPFRMKPACCTRRAGGPSRSMNIAQYFPLRRNRMPTDPPDLSSLKYRDEQVARAMREPWSLLDNAEIFAYQASTG